MVDTECRHDLSIPLGNRIPHRKKNQIKNVHFSFVLFLINKSTKRCLSSYPFGAIDQYDIGNIWINRIAFHMKSKIYIYIEMVLLFWMNTVGLYDILFGCYWVWIIVRVKCRNRFANLSVMSHQFMERFHVQNSLPVSIHCKHVINHILIELNINFVWIHLCVQWKSTVHPVKCYREIDTIWIPSNWFDVQQMLSTIFAR